MRNRKEEVVAYLRSIAHPEFCGILHAMLSPSNALKVTIETLGPEYPYGVCYYRGINPMVFPLETFRRLDDAIDCAADVLIEHMVAGDSVVEDKSYLKVCKPCLSVLTNKPLSNP